MSKVGQKNKGTYNLSGGQLFHMEREKSNSALEKGKKLPYHLLYARMQNNRKNKPVETPE